MARIEMDCKLKILDNVFKLFSLCENRLSHFVSEKRDADYIKVPFCFHNAIMKYCREVLKVV